jgi:rod shape-determining protein MreD
MDTHSRNSATSLFWAVAFSSFVALVLMVISLPQWIFYFWPDWIALIIVYWALHAPDRFGPFIGFVIGLLLEVLFVRKFGVQGLGLATLAFIVNSTHQQLRVLSMWQQTLLVVLFIGVFKLITGWLYGMVADFTITREYWYSLVGCMVAWPFVYILLEELRRIARIR